MPFSVTSSAFQMRQAIPTKYTCDGANISPPLTWSQAPANTQSFALIVDDPDSSSGDFTHWILYNISPDINQLSENFSNHSQNALHGLNSDQHTQYDGPCPPANETHT